MTRRDYIALAEILRTHKTAAHDYVNPLSSALVGGVIDNLIADIVDYLAERNPRFDRERFNAAVGDGSGR